MATPTWLAGTAGQTIVAGQDNQFLGTHSIQYIYTGAMKSQQVVDGSAAIGISASPPASGFTRLAESFVTATGQTTLGWPELCGKKVGNGCDLTLELYTNSSSKPNAQVGSTATTIPADFWATSNSYFGFPLPITGLTASTTYHIVLIAGDVNGNNAGDASNYISLEKSDQASGASTYAASTWTARTYGFQYSIQDLTVGPTRQLAFIYEDGGARYSMFNYNSAGSVSAVNEYTLSQGTGQMRSTRTITNPGATPTVVS